MLQRRIKANGLNDPSLISLSLEAANLGATGRPDGGGGCSIPPTASAIAASAVATGGAPAAVQLPVMLPPPPAPPMCIPLSSPLSLPHDVPPAPAPPSSRRANDLRQRQVSTLEDRLPPPPPPPAGVDAQRFASSYKLYGPDRPDLVA